MNDNLTINPNLQQLAAKIQTAQHDTQDDEAENFFNKMIDDISAAFKSDPMFQAGEIGTDQLITKIKQIPQSAMYKTLDKGVSDFFILLSWLVKPILLLSATASMENEATTLRQTRKTLHPTQLPYQVLQELYRRHTTDTDSIREVLMEQGYSDSDVQSLLDISYAVLDGNTLVNLAGRAAYDDKMASTYGLDDGFETLVSSLSDKISAAGMETDDFKRLWRAHWQNIPLNILQIMQVHGDLPDGVLEDMLRLQGFPEYFVPKIKSALFQQVNHLDLKRSYLEDIITDKNILVDELKKIGFSDAAAQTEAELYDYLKNKQKVKADIHKEKASTDILQSYSVEIITAAECKTLLNNIGYSDDDADFLIAHEDYQIQWKRTQMYLDAYKRGYLMGNISKTQLIAYLGHLNLPASYYNMIMETWDLELSHKSIKAEHLTKAEILIMLKNGLLTRPDAVDELAVLGFNSKYINLLIDNALHVKTTVKDITNG